MGQSRPLFVYFHSFLSTISIQIEKSIDGVLGIQTRGRRMVGADETTELWRPLFLVAKYCKIVTLILSRPTAQTNSVNTAIMDGNMNEAWPQ